MAAMTPINPPSGAWPTYVWRREVPRPGLDRLLTLRRVYGRGLRAALSLRPLRIDILIIVAYIVIIRIGSLPAAKVGIEIEGVPIFLTDFTLLMLVVVSLIKRPAHLLFWFSAGGRSTAIGRAVWLLCGVSVIYFAVSFSEYKLFAARDFAIFGYSLFFPLTYFALENRRSAICTARYFSYSGLVLAGLVLVQQSTGVEIPFIGIQVRVLLGRVVSFVGGDDIGAIIACSLVALVGYAVLDRSSRRFHVMGAVICFIALCANGTRSAFLGVMLAAGASFLLLSHRYRRVFAVVAALLVLGLVAGATLPPTLPGAELMHNFYLGIASAARGSDPNANFRLARWQPAFETWSKSPILGIGYGREILGQSLIGDRWYQGQFNAGMPHNTFLFLLERMGLIGFGLVLFAWASGIVKLAKAIRKSRGAEELAALNILIAMAGFAAFVLFFERPMNNAAFWILLAAGVRLAETSRAARPQRLFIRDQLRRGAAPSGLESGPKQCLAGFGNVGLSRPRFGHHQL